MKPASFNIARKSFPGMAPPCHLAQFSTMDRVSSGGLTVSTWSAIMNRPRGLKTLSTSFRALTLSGTRLKTPLEITTPKLASGKGRPSAETSWKLTLLREVFRRFSLACSSISDMRSIPTTLPFGPTMVAAISVSTPAPQPMSRTVSPSSDCPKAEGVSHAAVRG